LKERKKVEETKSIVYFIFSTSVLKTELILLVFRTEFAARIHSLQ